MAASPLDLTADLRQVVALATSEAAVDRLLTEALDAFLPVVPYDLAAVLLLEGEELWVRAARGRLAGAAVRRHRITLAAFPTVRAALRSHRARIYTEHDHAAGDGDPYDGVLDLPHGHSCMVVPLVADDLPLGVLTFDRTVCAPYPEATLALAQAYGALLANAMRYERQSALLLRLRAQWEEHNRLLADRIGGASEACALMEASRSPAMAQAVALAKRVAPTTTPVVITGETGTGKEVLAHAIHGWSGRAARPMVSVNCAALPAGLIESELFGHLRGAFSGATRERIGRFQTANGGTLFLDEVGEIPLELQAKFLRAVQDGTFEPVGCDRTVRVDVRILAATHVDLKQAVAEGRFREDLYYRLHVFPIEVPPLRARREDLGRIAADFLANLARRTGRGPWSLSEAALAALGRHDWPGNVRELVNHLERATILAGPGERAIDEAPPAAPVAREGFATLAARERDYIDRVLRATGGKIYGPGGAAELLGIHGSTLASRMRKLGLGGARDYR
ncbi:MAG: AAA family ATPase [Nitrospirae bacterium CG06_land_8_20_14_3_00_70_43]|nr:MAG: AAA family ATPase [Nitrospirae bacterium CG06_land_8_20_14_3_00_70_43]PJB95266.1 MAG: AAA family ATPase [Nitrospirae bacterium CG_4_9_14_0_8_um_filter_70_14]